MSLDEPMPRPANAIGGGLQHERTALAWERTAISMMVVGVALARHAATEGHAFLGSIGVIQTLVGASLLLWTARNYDMLHNPATSASAVPQVGLTRWIGGATVVFTSVALVISTVLVIRNTL